MTLALAPLVARLLIAAALGAIVGAERDTTSRGAGARTHALVALGSAMFTVAGAYGFGDVAAADRADPARVAAQVATGVGFIGAGAIMRHGTSVLGVTTAATVWLAAGIGVLTAAGGAALAAVATVMALVVLVALRKARPLARRIGRCRSVLEVEYRRGHGTLGPLLRYLEDHNGRLEHLSMIDDDSDARPDGIRRVTLFVVLPSRSVLDGLVDDFARRPEIHTVRVARGERD